MKLFEENFILYTVDEDKYIDYAKNNPPFEITIEYVNDEINEVVVKMEEGKFIGDPSKIILRNGENLKLFDKERYMSYSDDNRVAFWELNRMEFLDKIKALGSEIQMNKIVPHYHSIGLKSGKTVIVEIVIYISNKTKEIGNEQKRILELIRKDSSKIYAKVAFMSDEEMECFNCPEFLKKIK